MQKQLSLWECLENHLKTHKDSHVREFNIKTISDFGCGDGNQLKSLKGFENYCGFDISSNIIRSSAGLILYCESA